MFAGGIVLALAVLLKQGQEQPSVASLKAEIFASVFGEDYAIPVDSNVTNVMNSALATYVTQDSASVVVEWIVFFILLFSFLIELLYSRFANEDQKKLGGLRGGSCC
jgi:hypothetical protein